MVSIHTDQLLWLLKRAFLILFFDFAFLREGRGNGGGGGGGEKG